VRLNILERIALEERSIAGEKLAKKVNNLNSQKEVKIKVKPSVIPKEYTFSCIYMAQTEDGKCYIGQTLLAPEHRWKMHRRNKSGPFKNDAKYANWTILRAHVLQTELNKLESFLIGYYDAYETGYNENRGNDRKAYSEGQIKRQQEETK